MLFLMGISGNSVCTRIRSLPLDSDARLQRKNCCEGLGL